MIQKAFYRCATHVKCPSYTKLRQPLLEALYQPIYNSLLKTGDNYFNKTPFIYSFKSKGEQDCERVSEDIQYALHFILQNPNSLGNCVLFQNNKNPQGVKCVRVWTNAEDINNIRILGLIENENPKNNSTYFQYINNQLWYPRSNDFITLSKASAITQTIVYNDCLSMNISPKLH